MRDRAGAMCRRGLIEMSRSHYRNSAPLSAESQISQRCDRSAMSHFSKSTSTWSETDSTSTRNTREAKAPGGTDLRM